MNTRLVNSGPLSVRTANGYGWRGAGHLQELYTGIGAQNWWLTMLGVRSLLEFVMVEKVGDNGSFVKNLEKFLDGGFISKIQLDALGPLIEAGHATTHRG